MVTPTPATRLVLACLLWTLTGCKPPAAPSTAQSQTPGEPSPQVPGPARRPPGTAELASFLRSTLPPVIKLVEVKTDPPTPMPNTTPGSNVWLYTVRLILAPAEDELAEATPQDAQAFQAVLDEQSVLAAWSQAYNQSPYARLYPGFTLNAPDPAAPKLLRVARHKDQPLPPIYAKMAAEWQVDHWQFSSVDMALPDADDGQFRHTFDGPVFVQGEPATERFLAAARATIAEARPKKATLEAVYADDLAKATRPGTLYRGQVSLGSSVVAAEVRFLEPPTAGQHSARFEVRMPGAPGYVFTYTATLARQVPIHPAPVPRNDSSNLLQGDADTLPKADLSVGLEHVAGKEVVSGSVANQMLMSLTHYPAPRALLLSLSNGRLEGKVATSDYAYRLSAQRAP